jgi:uncharacterized protein (TIGR02677 family)
MNAEPQPFAYLSTPNAALYTRILGVFAQARARFTVHLRPEDVTAELRRDVVPGSTAAGAAVASPVPVPVEAVSSALDQLALWGNLHADADTGRVTTVEDFHRARYLYQLTRHGQAAAAAIAAYDEALGRRGQLQAVALADIAEQLSALLGLAQREEPDPAKVHLALLGLADRFASLADNAQDFMSSLRRTIDFQDGDEAAFVAYKERLVGYIERFIGDLAGRGAQIADLLGRIDEAGVSRLLELAARREAADAAPDGAGDGSGSGTKASVTADDGSGAGLQGGAAAVEAALAAWKNRWRGLNEWFISQGAHRPSQAKLLRTSAVSAITNLINTVSALNERRGGRVDRSADFRALALFFAEAPCDEDAHRLWRAAFALTPARHLTIDAETEQVWEAEQPAPNTPWDQAPALRISPRLRETGSYERRGAQNRVADRSAARAALEEHAEREAAQTAAARARLATDGPTLLSDLAGPDGLDRQAFRLFLGVLGDALAARNFGETQCSATTGDGTMEVRLKLVDESAIIDIRTEDGVLRGPEHVVEILDLAPAGEAVR